MDLLAGYFSCRPHQLHSPTLPSNHHPRPNEQCSRRRALLCKRTARMRAHTHTNTGCSSEGSSNTSRRVACACVCVRACVRVCVCVCVCVCVYASVRASACLPGPACASVCEIHIRGPTYPIAEERRETEEERAYPTAEERRETEEERASSLASSLDNLFRFQGLLAGSLSRNISMAVCHTLCV